MSSTDSREVWHRIYEFPEYEVNSRGHVRIIVNSKKLIPEKGLIANVYKLWNKGDAKKVKASDLVERYFPELSEDKESTPLEWRQLDEFPDYEVTKFGGIRNRDTKYELPVLRPQKNFGAPVALWKDRIRGVYDLNQLVDSAFPEEIRKKMSA